MMGWFNYDETNPEHRELRSRASAVKNPETWEQVYVVNWAKANEHRFPELKYLLHIPNGGGRSKAEAGILKAMGVRGGVSDFFLPVSRWYEGPYGENQPVTHGLWIEMKAVAWRSNAKKPGEIQLSPGLVSLDQEEWLRSMLAQGHAVSVAWDRVQAQGDLEMYLSRRWVQPNLSWMIERRLGPMRT